MHPIIVLLAVIGGGQLAGIFGVPALAVFRVFFYFFHARIQTKASPYLREASPLLVARGGLGPHGSSVGGAIGCG